MRSGRSAATSTPAAGAALLIGFTQSGLTTVGNIAATTIWFCVFSLPPLAASRFR